MAEDRHLFSITGRFNKKHHGVITRYQYL